jgi:hypothetical protein
MKLGGYCFIVYSSENRLVVKRIINLSPRNKDGEADTFCVGDMLSFVDDDLPKMR